LGAKEEQIVADYALTNGWIEPISFLNDDVDPEVTRYIMAAEPEYMAEALNTMKEEFGSISGYLREGLGLSNADRDKIREILVN